VLSTSQVLGFAVTCLIVIAIPGPRFARSPRRLELVGGLGGLTMIGLGVTLALTGRRD
jgi:threonine/homoserine/homoserine lactone efflux protein